MTGGEARVAALGRKGSRRLVRVLIVDDSAFVRRTLREILRSSRDIEVVGAAVDGDDGLRLVEELSPDVITLDLEMPRLDGFAFLRILMRRHPLPVIVVSSHTERQTVLRALELGALDFVAKPDRVATPNLLQIRGELVDKVLAGASSLVEQLQVRIEPPGEGGEEGVVETGPGTAQPSDSPMSPTQAGAQAQGAQAGPTAQAASGLLVVGASTGGPTSLRRFLTQLPVSLPLGVVVAQHMPPRFTRAFAQRLDRDLAWKVREAEPGMILCLGEVVIGQGGHHMEVLQSEAGLSLRVQPALPGDRYVPSVDRLFSSAADAAGRQVLALVLTGMGSDGAMGVQYVKVHGGQVLAEAESTSVVFGMPRAAIHSGAVDHVLPLDAMASRVHELAVGLMGR